MSSTMEEALLDRRGMDDTNGDTSPNRRGDDPPSPSTSEELAFSDAESHLKSGEGDDMSAVALAERSTGPQTGVKGVRADASYADRLRREGRAEAVKEANAQMRDRALGKNQTWEEDDAASRAEAEAGVKPGQSVQASRRADSDDEELAEIRRRRLQNIKSQTASNENRRKRMAGENGQGAASTNKNESHYGHLREVTPEQYPNAIEGESPSTYVVVHIYVRNVHACAMLTSALASLARMYTRTKFIQVRAGSIGFGSSMPGRQSGATSIDGTLVDTASTFSEKSLDADEGDERAEDLVPTLLVYRAGKVVANLVRVDLESAWNDGSERAIADLLAGHNALQQ